MRIRNKKHERIPYALVIGDEEVSNKAVTLESRDNGKIGQLSLDMLFDRLMKEISEKTR